MTTFLWTIAQLNRLTTDDFVVTVHYNVSATEGEYQTSTYGTTSYMQVAGETYIPYADLTEAIVVGWAQESLGKEVVEAQLQSQLDLMKNPVEAAGIPWA